jgi:branched-chain amino acid transport system ATP-binding protein
MSAPLLDIAGLSGGYGKVDVLKDVSLSVAQGSITCLLGPNGAGKSTLMMMIAGLLKPRTGTARLEGRAIGGQPPHAILAQGIAFVAQDRLLFGNMSVRDNLKVGAYRRNDRDEVEADLARLYERFPRLHQRRDQKAGTLSGGEQQMLAMARALMSRPKLLLLDEPSLGLAPMIVQDIFRLIGEINAEGVGVLLVEQQAPMALGIAHHAYLLEQGRVTFGGSPDRLAAQGLLDRAYFGRTGSDPAPTCRIEV